MRSDWREIREQAGVFCFYAREFEGADSAYGEQLQAKYEGEEPHDWGLDVRLSGNAVALRAKKECEALQEKLKGYHEFITWVISKGGL